MVKFLDAQPRLLNWLPLATFAIGAVCCPIVVFTCPFKTACFVVDGIGMLLCIECLVMPETVRRYSLLGLVGYQNPTSNASFRIWALIGLAFIAFHVYLMLTRFQ